jgi:hypothetical protein
MICWFWDSGFMLVSYSLHSGTSTFGPGSFCLCLGNSHSGPRSSGLFLGTSRESSCMGSGSVVWGGLSIYGGSESGCGCDGGFSVMMVDGWVSGLGSSYICMIGVVRTIERVWGTVDDMGWGFRTLLSEILVLVLLATVSMMYATLRISLTSLPINIISS